MVMANVQFFELLYTSAVNKAVTKFYRKSPPQVLNRVEGESHALSDVPNGDH